MTRPETDELARWLAAEQAGSPEEGDAWFAAVAGRHLPRVAEPAWLAARVMAALPRRHWGRRLGVVFDAAGSRWGRVAVTLSLGVLGLAFALVSPGQLPGFLAHVVEAAARLAAGLSTATSAALGVAVACCSVMVDLGRAAMLVAAYGPVPALIAANVLVACLASAGLSRLLASREECL